MEFNPLVNRISGWWVLCFLVGFGEFGVSISVSPVSAQSCGSLFTSGVEIHLKSGSVHPNLEGEELPSGAFWNVTTALEVSAGCVLFGCSRPHFQGQCQSLQGEGRTELPPTLDNILSANCFCPPKTCDCAGEFNLRRKTCGRAYVNSGGCSACDPTYTDLREGSVLTFPREFEERVSSVMVRPGCSLTLHDEGGLQGNSKKVEGIRKKWRTSVKSYVCECNDVEYEMPTTPRPSSYPEELEIPLGLRDLINLRSNGMETHPGILAALSSIKGKRSSRNAYILLLGTSGAGKSSTINHLFDNPNMTRVGAHESTTDAIHEFRVPVPVSELGILNSELRVIDTPGIGDTKGTESDARFLASLEQFLSTHEELNSKIPNVVLVFHKFSDNRFGGQKSEFVRMLRCVDAMRGKLTDASFSNVVFVFSHFMSETSDVTSDPSEKLRLFKETIEAHTGFPQPIVLAVAENKPELHGLVMINGYSKLPNGEFYAKNLLDSISKVTEGGGDLVGDAVIRSAFRNPDDLNISSVEIPIVLSNHSRVSHYLGFLSDLTFDSNKTEISEKLREAEKSMPALLKQMYPESLAYLQNALNAKFITSVSQLPRTGPEIIRLLSTLRHNDAVSFLLQEAFDLSPPELQQNIVAGFSYDVFQDRALPSSPVELGEPVASEIGYKIPGVLSCSATSHTKDVAKFLLSEEELVSERLKTLGISGNIPVSKFSGRRKHGWNFLEEGDRSSMSSLTALREFRTFQLTLFTRFPFTQKFQAAVDSLKPFNESDVTSVETWKTFFSEFGTHVVKSVYGGGSVEVRLTKNANVTTNEALEALGSYFRFLEDISIGFGENYELESKPGIYHSLRFLGGNTSIVSGDLTRIPLEKAAELFSKWKESIKTDPIILESELLLVPLSVVVRRLGANVSTEVERATRLLFSSSLEYSPPPSRLPPPPPRQKITTQIENFFSDILKEILNAGRKVLKQLVEVLPSVIVTLASQAFGAAG